ncbi:hypothetical protein [Pseudomonas sp. JZ134]|uniref:hypothetical protein n=1 Tax=Pseudomonas sp. JZ134 TaxID=2806615 RepID=UPI003DA058B7
MKESLKHIFFLFDKVFSTLISFFSVLLFSRLLDSKWRFREARTAIVLGNGPSLKNDIKELKQYVNRASVDIWVVNNFCFSKEFFYLKPAFYVLADPNYWLPVVSPEADALRSRFILEVKGNVNWPMTILIPLSAKGSNFCKKLKSSFISVEFYNSTPVAGSLRFSGWLMQKQLGMPAALNVLIAALSLALCASYKKIYIFGADHSWHEELFLSSNGEALVKQYHFYAEEVKARPIYRPTQVCFTVGDMFLRWGKVFKNYEVLRGFADMRKVHVINVSSKSYIDAFERSSISDIYFRDL